MKNLLMDPAFPDLVAEWAGSDDTLLQRCECANDNGEQPVNDVADPLLLTLAKLEIAATRLW